jgi:pimeloyl-ACP methyl ester carboxylesterase
MRRLLSRPSALVVLLAASLLTAPRGVPAQPPAAAATTAPKRQFTTRHVTSADGTRIAYLVAGTGRPLVMVHGSMTIADEWLAVAERLGATRRVIVVERRGRGRSGDAPQHSIAVEAQDLAAVVADVARSAPGAAVTKDASTAPSTGAVDLFGHSYGGAVVGRYAIDAGFPGAVVLYDPGAGLNGPIAADGRAPVRALLDAGERDSALTRAFETIMGAPPQVIAGIRQNAALWAQYRTLLPSWVREVQSLDAFAPTAEELARIRGRTTILLGDRSGPMLTAIAGTWVGRQPGVTVLPLRGQGHTGHLEAPAYVAERIRTALQP